MRRSGYKPVLFGGLGLAAVLSLPSVFRFLPIFAVRQIEFVGLHYLSPEQVLLGSGITEKQNLFDNISLIERRLSRVRGIEKVSVERELPGTLRIRLTETVPVAFVSTPERLVALDRDARPLPYDPVDSDLDLPLVARPDRKLVRALATVRAADNSLFAGIKNAFNDGKNKLVLDSEEGRIVMRPDVSVEDIRSVGVVLRHLAQTGRPFEEIDLRYDGWVVVRRGVL